MVLSIGNDPLRVKTERLPAPARCPEMIRKLKSDPRTGKRRNLGTFKTRAEAEKHERAVQYFKRRGTGLNS